MNFNEITKPIQNHEYEFIRKAMDQLFHAAEERGFDDRGIADAILQVVILRFFEIADSYDQAAVTVLLWAHHVFDHFDKGDYVQLNLADLTDKKNIN